ncbi:sulfotransferase family protein [Alteromonas oceani]|uniref:Sulfotransferase family protein n=1 Tax=Alteromonas oceani TaxID=2071609 RepID=A0ABV7K2A2_9ALTE|nr:sulfotransferase [Alteromonas oceani]
MNKTSPHFIGIGAQRSGTSWMFECFLEHPEIYMPRKEMQFFNKRPLSELPEYLSQFKETDKISGEITPDYLSSREAIDGIAEAFPDIKLIVILRNPVERTRSSHNLYKERGVTSDNTLLEAIENHSAAYEKSLYGEQIEYLFSKINRDNVKIVFFEDLKTDPIGLIQNIFSFIGVDSSFVPSAANRNFNASSIGFGSNRIAKTLTLIQNYLFKRSWGRAILQIKKTEFFKRFKSSLIEKKKVKPEENAKYYIHFKNDIDKLEKEIGFKVPDSWKYNAR